MITVDHRGCEEGGNTMNQTPNAFQELLNRRLDDATFRDAFQADPQHAIQSSGLDLTLDELAALEGAQWNLSDGALAERANKPRIGRM